MSDEMSAHKMTEREKRLYEKARRRGAFFGILLVLALQLLILALLVALLAWPPTQCALLERLQNSRSHALHTCQQANRGVLRVLSAPLRCAAPSLVLNVTEWFVKRQCPASDSLVKFK